MGVERQFAGKNAFTLLEVIVVIVIIGVLAGLALPKLFRSVEYSYLPEALLNIRLVRESVEKCLLMSDDNTCGCVAGPRWYERLGMADPDLSPGARFTYTMDYQCNPALQRYQFRAVRYGGSGSLVFDYRHHKTQGEGFTITGDGVYDGFKIVSE